MKVLKKALALVLLSTLLFCNVVSAAPTTQANADTQSIQTSYTQDELNQIRNAHKKVVQQGLATLNTDGTIKVNTNATTLGVDEGIFKEYIESVENLNDIIKLGVASFNKNFDLKVKSKDETTKIVYQRDKKMQQTSTRSNNRFDTQTESQNISINVSSTLPSLYAFSIASANRQVITKYYNSVYLYDPETAYLSAVGYWVGKVMEGGAWDYKVASGYAPYSKQWTAYTRYGSSTRTSEWFGNYNYGFTGKFLFSLSTLLAGGDGVSLLFHHTMDDQGDKDDVTQGYNEY